MAGRTARAGRARSRPGGSGAAVAATKRRARAAAEGAAASPRRTRPRSPARAAPAARRGGARARRWRRGAPRAPPRPRRRAATRARPLQPAPAGVAAAARSVWSARLLPCAAAARSRSADSASACWCASAASRSRSAASASACSRRGGGALAFGGLGERLLVRLGGEPFASAASAVRSRCPRGFAERDELGGEGREGRLEAVALARHAALAVAVALQQRHADQQGAAADEPEQPERAAEEREAAARGRDGRHDRVVSAVPGR